MSSLKFGEINKDRTKKKYLGILTYGENTKLSDGTTLQFNHDNKYFSSIDIVDGKLIVKNNNGDILQSLDIPTGTTIKTVDGNPIVLQETTLYHNTSGAAKGDYGDKYAQSPSFGESFKVPFIQVDEYGHINYINTHDVSIPSIDNELSSTSTNPVQNKVIYEALQNIDGGGSTSIWEGTQEEFDSIENKDANIVYFIKENDQSEYTTIMEGSSTELIFNYPLTGTVTITSEVKNSVSEIRKSDELGIYGIYVNKAYYETDGNGNIFKLDGLLDMSNISSIIIHGYLKSNTSNVTNSLYIAKVDNPTNYKESNWTLVYQNTSNIYEEFSVEINIEDTETRELYFYISHGAESTIYTSFALIDKIIIKE